MGDGEGEVVDGEGGRGEELGWGGHAVVMVGGGFW